MEPTTVTIHSFGYDHAGPPEADLVLDVRRYLRDPARMRAGALLDHDGRDQAVRDIVLATPGAREALEVLTRFVNSFPAGKRCAVAVGCVGGKHRSVALAEELARELARHGVRATLRHHHVHLPRLLRGTDRASR